MHVSMKNNVYNMAVVVSHTVYDNVWIVTILCTITIMHFTVLVIISNAPLYLNAAETIDNTPCVLI